MGRISTRRRLRKSVRKYSDRKRGVRPRRLACESLEDRRLLATYDFTFTGVTEIVNDAVFTNDEIVSAAGSGNIHSFVRIQNTGTEQGYNTDRGGDFGTAIPAQYDEGASATFNRALQLSSIPVAVIDGVAYREFLLDINQTNANPLLSLNEVEVYTSSVPLSEHIFTDASGPTGTLIYDLDFDEDNTIALNYELEAGSGRTDLFVYVPNNLFGDDTEFVTLYSKFGEPQPTNDGYEEWAVRAPGALHSVAGTKFLDIGGLAADGIWDPDGADDVLGNADDEVGLEGWTIYIDENGNGTFDVGEISTTTDADGNYTFNNLIPGITYTIREDSDNLPAPPENFFWSQTFPMEGDNYEHVVTIGETDVTDLNFGNTLIQLVTFGSFVVEKYHDLNADGDYEDGADPGLDGWNVELYVDTNENGVLDADEFSEGPVESRTTESGGFADFLNIQEDRSYILVEEMQDGWLESPDQNTTVVNPNDYGGYGRYGYAFYFDAPSSAANIRFGNYQVATKSGYKYQDTDASGDLSAGDVGLENWEITL
ncbi:hypothetical protein NG895_21050, partial [Aeoliella sp. ICT_H6.2]